jgi:glucan-binding YG repeat protein
MKKVIPLLLTSILLFQPPVNIFAEIGESTKDGNATSGNLQDVPNVQGLSDIQNVQSELGEQNVQSVSDTQEAQDVQDLQDVTEVQNDVDAVQGNWVLDNGIWYYYVSDVKQIGWIHYNEHWYYLQPNTGAMQTGWIMYGGKLFYLNPTGEMQTGWLLFENKWYYFDTISGSMQVGWVQYNEKWYYLDPVTGVMRTWWIPYGGKWFYLNSGGEMQTGWVYDGYWYYFNQYGEMQTGWLNETNRQYYLDQNGKMVTGWLYYDNHWYYFSKDGIMQTGWVLYQNQWYFLDDNGVMLTGWFQVDSKWYYAYSSGILARNTMIGPYYVGISGAWLQDLVNPRTVYTYEQMETDIQELQNLYPDLIQTQVIGTSVDGRNLYAIKLGKGEKEIFLNGAHHAREHMTTNVLMEMIDQYAQSYIDGSVFSGYDTRDVLNKMTLWFVPMVNPDGVTLVQKGHLSAKDPNYVLSLNNGSVDFSSWKANIRGVDLNRQYPADWENIRGNTGVPSKENFKGYQPLTEPEALAVYNFTKQHNFKTAVAYHSSGQILYWYFKQAGSDYTRDYNLALQYKNITGYSLVNPTSNPSGGGYTDWFIQEMKQPGFTPEISPYTYGKPVPVSYFDSIWEQNKQAGLMLASDAYYR